jgi:hypothetical protein
MRAKRFASRRPQGVEDDPAPSERYVFEPEFTARPPRPIPDRLDDGPYARRRRSAAITLALTGLVCLLLAGAPGVEVLARYVLPLGYLKWIGIALLVSAAGAYLALSLRIGPFRYVRDGLPLAARVVEIAKVPTAIVNGAPSTHGFVATVIFRDPETGDLAQADVKSSDFSSARKDAYETPFRVGDDVTAVYLPGRLWQTMRLYAFLELSPQVNLRPKTARGRQDSPWKVATLLALVPALFVVLFANVYAIGRYHPIRFSYGQALAPMVAGGLVLGGALWACLYLAHRSEQRTLQRRALEAVDAGTAIEIGTPFLGSGFYGWSLRVIVAAGAPLLGAITTLCWCFLSNAWLDRSPPQEEPATIVGMTMTTHALLFREYEIEYHLADASDTNKMLTTPEHCALFDGAAAVATVRAGRFGWPWVETLVPRPAER